MTEAQAPGKEGVAHIEAVRDLRDPSYDHRVRRQAERTLRIGADKPYVSVVIPTRDRQASLGAAIHSALVQTHVPFEVWVVDDASAVPVELSQHGRHDIPVHLIRLKHQLGPAGARNAAARRCHGELIAFLDDDDEWLPQKTARQISALNNNGDEVALVGSGYDLWEGHDLAQRHVPAERDLQRAMLEEPQLAPSTVIVRRDAFEAVGGFDESLRLTEDWDLWVRLLDRYEAAVLPEILCNRRNYYHSPDAMLAACNNMFERLGPRIDALPSKERARVRAHHLFNAGVWLARMGRRKESVTTLWHAWRLDPSTLRPLVHMGRTLVGERSWETVARLARTRTLSRGSGPRRT